MKHTPGPWSIEPLTTAIIDSERIQVATVSNYGGAITKEAQANAKLISSAPELLEALKQAKPFINTSVFEGKQAWNKVQEAINKAEGRE